MRTAMMAFNSYDEDGRVTTVLLHTQHALEMLLKAVLCQKKTKVLDKSTGNVIGFEKCLRICQSNHALLEEEAGIFRTIDALRDAAQHWFIYVSEDLLYLHMRATVTAFDAYLKRSLDTDLHSLIPPRVLPVSTRPLGDFDFLVDKEYKLIAELLKPGRRQSDEARARIRSLLAMEAIVSDEVAISENDIARIERAIKSGEQFDKVFPRLNTISSSLTGDGPSIIVHFSKKQGAPVRFVGGDDPEGAAAVREIDLQKKYHMRASQLAKKLSLTEPKSLALRRYAKIDDNPQYKRVFEFGKMKIDCFSDGAFNSMKSLLDGGTDVQKIWNERGSKPTK